MRDHHRMYELMMIVSPLRASDEERGDLLERLRQTIESLGGELVAVQQDAPWGRRKLAYPIRAYTGGEASRRNFQEGFYILAQFRVAAVKVIEVDRMLRLHDGILRYLITVVESGTERNSVEEMEEMEETEEYVEVDE